TTSLALRGVRPDDAGKLDQGGDQNLADDELADARQALEARQADIERVPGLGGGHPDRELRREVRRIVEAAHPHGHAAGPLLRKGNARRAAGLHDPPRPPTTRLRLGPVRPGLALQDVEIVARHPPRVAGPAAGNVLTVATVARHADPRLAHQLVAHRPA